MWSLSAAATCSAINQSPLPPRSQLLEQPLRRLVEFRTIPFAHILVVEELHVGRQLSGVEINGQQNPIRSFPMSEQGHVVFLLADSRRQVVWGKSANHL